MYKKREKFSITNEHVIIFFFYKLPKCLFPLPDPKCIVASSQSSQEAATLFAQLLTTMEMNAMRIRTGKRMQILAGKIDMTVKLETTLFPFCAIFLSELLVRYVTSQQ